MTYFNPHSYTSHQGSTSKEIQVAYARSGSSLSRTFLLSLITIALTFVGLGCLGQNNHHKDWWYFGSGQGMQFTAAGPVGISGGQLQTTEATASISDKYGNLVFYTQGYDLYDASHTKTPTQPGMTYHCSAGLYSCLNTAKQGVTILCDNYNQDQYHVFAIGGIGYDSLLYFKYDASLPGNGTAANPLGDILPGSKRSIKNDVSEGITAIRHPNNRDWWIVTGDKNSGNIVVYPLNAAGFVATPSYNGKGGLTSSVAYSQFRASPDQTKLAGVSLYSGAVWNINPNTGVPSGGTLIPSFGAPGGIAPSGGVEFSPNSQFMYCGIGIRNSGGFVYTSGVGQWDVSVPLGTIGGTFQSVDTFPGFGANTDLQLGPDNKIYVCAYTFDFHVLNAPNQAGAACSPTPAGMPFQAAINVMVFPQFYPPADTNYFTPSNTSICAGQTVNFNNPNQSNYDCFSWDFNDPSSGGSNTSTNQNTSHTFNIPGTYNVRLISQQTCHCELDTTIRTITVHPPQFGNRSASICQGDSIFLGGRWINSAITINDTIFGATTQGCDSIYITTVTVVPTTSSSSTVTICQGQTATIHGTPQSTAGTYTQTFTGSNGCDSTSTITLIVNPTQSTSSNASICSGQSITIHGTVQTTAGTYTQTFTGANGCDSTSAVTLTVTPVINTNGTVSICAGGSATVHGNTVSSPGTYVDTLSSAGGCDSISSIVVSLTPAITHSVNVNICQGQTYFAGGANQNTSGSYVDTLNSAGGCDSILTTFLTVAPAINTTGNVAICTGGSAVIHGNTVTTPGTYVDTLTSAGGCDSISTIVVSLTPAITHSINVNICQGQTYFAGGANQSNSGSYVDTLSTTGGCDSILTTVLTVAPAITTTGSVTICAGGSVTVHGNSVNTPGNYVDTLTSAGGCDSISTITVSVAPALTHTVAVSICQGQSHFAGGSNQTASGTYVDTLTSTGGCDSILTTQLTVTPTITTNTFAFVCLGDSTLIHGNYTSAPGTYVDTATSIGGCDSISSVLLAFLPTYYNTVNATICQGDSLFLGGVWQTNSGSYSDSLQTAGGCDSVITTMLTVLPQYNLNTTLSICPGDSVLIGGVYRHTAGNYVDSLQTTQGCDSIVGVVLTITQPSHGSQVVSICPGDSVLVQNTYVNAPGLYVDTIYGGAATGCDSIIATTVMMLPVAQGYDTISICGSDVVYIGGVLVTGPGIYTDTLPNASYNGCDSVVSVYVYIQQNRYLYPTQSDSVVCVGEPVTLTIVGADNATWDNGMTGNTITVYPEESTTYEVSDTTVCGSPSTYIHVDVLAEPVFYIPNIFSPNGDGYNDEFVVRQKGIEEFHIQVYSRWGEVVFESSDPFQAWDGTFKGKHLNSAVFVYQVIAKTKCAHDIDRKGEIAITR